MIHTDDIYLNAWCLDCGYPSQIPGSTPMSKVCCNQCNSTRLEFEHVMSVEAIKRFAEAFKNLPKKR